VFATTTNYAAVVRPLQVLVMVVAVLFFARVLRVATVESRPVDGTSANVVDAPIWRWSSSNPLIGQ